MLELANVEVREKGSSSFEIPSRAEREDLWPGDLIKLILATVDEYLWLGEYLWVKVLNRDGTDPEAGKLYSGTVISNPHEGNKVSFGPENVAEIAHVTLRKTREKQFCELNSSRGKKVMSCPRSE
jgi:hypothetical protein